MKICPSKNLLVSLVGLFLVSISVGCNRQTAATPDGTSPLNADKVLEMMIAAYRNASAYSDQGRIRISRTGSGPTYDEQAPFTTHFVRPNKLRVNAYHVELVADGNHLWAQIRDEATDNLDGQVLRRPIPETLDIDILRTNPVLFDQLFNQLGGAPITLELLLDEDALAELLSVSQPPELLTNSPYDDHDCYRVRLAANSSDFTFWIDAKSYILRKLEYPPGEVRMVAEFPSAQFQISAPHDTFVWSLSEQAKVVRFFSLPPQPLPSNLFGKIPGNFQLTRADGGSVSLASLRGRTAILMWFNNHPLSFEALSHLQSVYEKHKIHRDSSFYAVWAEGSNISDNHLQQLLAQRGIDIPFVRDEGAYGRDAFNISVAPTLVILNKEGKLQVFEVGSNGQLTEQLPRILDRLANGADLASELIEQFELEEKGYRQNLAAAQGQGTSSVVEIPQIAIQPRKLPDQLTLQPRWQCREIASPGNLLIVDDDQHPSIVVMDGWKDIATLSLDGKVVERRSLDLPAAGLVTVLRTAVDRQTNRYYLGISNLARQIFLFDHQWNVLLAFPSLEQKHDGVRDAQLADLDADGQLELYVGFWGLAGVQSRSFAGQLRWSNRHVSSVLSITKKHDNVDQRGQILVTSDQGSIFPIQPNGRTDPTVHVGRRAIHYLAVATDASGWQTPYCGLSWDTQQRLYAIGLNDQLQEQWSYELPAGSHQNQIQTVLSGLLHDRGHWIFPRPDGSIHFVAHDGSFFDHFAYGESLRGVAVTQEGNRQGLVIATQKESQWWDVLQ